MRVHVGERALTAWLLLDVSASMTFGTADRRKADVAEGVALAIGHVATRRGNRLGVIAVGGGEPRILRPRQGRLGVLGLLHELRAEPEADGAGPTGLADALSRCAALARARGFVAVVSDFRGPRDWVAPLQRLRARQGVLAIEIVDPREQTLPAVGDLWMVDPETGRQIQVNTNRRAIRRRFAEARGRRARRGRRRDAQRGRRPSRAVDGRRLAAYPGWAPPALGGDHARKAQPVTFQEPTVLVGLVLVPLAAIAYLMIQRRRTREAAAFASPALMPNVLTRRPGWRRHVPPALALLALARPRRRARPARAQHRRAAAAGDGDHGHRRVGLDGGHRRLAEPARGGDQGGPYAGRRAARQLPARHGHVLRRRAAGRAARHRSRAGEGRARPARGRRRHRDGRRARPRPRGRARPRAQPGRRRRAPAARDRRPALGRQEHVGRPAAARGRRARPAAEDPDQHRGARDRRGLRRGAGTVRAAPADRRPAGPRDAAPDRPHDAAGARSRPRTPTSCARSTPGSARGCRARRSSRRSPRRSPAARSCS